MRSSSKWMKPTLDHDTPNYPLDEFWLQHSPQLSWATPNPSNDPSKPRSLRSYNSMVRPYSEFRLTPPPNKKKDSPLRPHGPGASQPGPSQVAQPGESSSAPQRPRRVQNNERRTTNLVQLHQFRGNCVITGPHGHKGKLQQLSLNVGAKKIS